MRNHDNTLTLHPLFLGHDLLIELGRLQVELEDRSRNPANDAGAQESLETRRAMLAAAFETFSGAGKPAH